MKQEVSFCLRVKIGAVIWYGQQRMEVASLIVGLPKTQTQAEWVVDVGANKLVKAVRLLVKRVPQKVAEQRQERIRQYDRKHSASVNALVLELAHWTILVTNAPCSMLLWS